jgi:hypothetical protein
VQAAAVAHEGAARRRGDQLAEGGDPILQRHRLEILQRRDNREGVAGYASVVEEEPMKRILSCAVVVSFLAVAGVLVVPPLPSGSAAAAEVSEKQVMDELAKVKKMVADMEMKMKSKTMMMDAMGREKAMQMLKDISSMLERMQQSP